MTPFGLYTYFIHGTADLYCVWNIKTYTYLLAYDKYMRDMQYPNMTSYIAIYVYTMTNLNY